MKNIAIIVAVAAVAGCATTPVPADKYARTHASISAAEVINAQQVPNAAVHMRLAREQLERAKRLLKDGENERAGYLLMRAEADANAAVHLAREVRAEQDAAQTMENVRQLKAQMEVPQS